MNPSYILKLKGRCLNCGAIVKERRADIICSSSYQEAEEHFKTVRGSSQYRNLMRNHECSDMESGYVESVSLMLEFDHK